MEKKFLWTVVLATVLFAPIWATGRSQAAPSGMPVVTFLLGTANMPNANASIVPEIRARTGIDFQVTFVPEIDYGTRLNALIAAGNLPDIVKAGATMQLELVEHNALLQLDTLLRQYGQHILADRPNGFNYGLNGNGKIWGIPDATDFPFSTAIRRDWTRNVGAPVPQGNIVNMKISDFVNLMRAFTNNDPDRNGVADTFGWCFQLGGGGTGMANPIFWAFDVPAQGWWLENGNIRTWLKHPNFLKGMEVLRTMYQEGLMEREFITIPETIQSFQKLFNGTAGAATWNVAGMTNNWIGRYVDGLQADDFYYAVLTDDDGTGGGFYVAPSSNYVSISANSRNPEAAMRLLDFFHTFEGESLIYLGIEGKHYEWTDRANYKFRYLEPYASNITLQRADGAYSIWQYIRPSNNIELLTLTPITIEIVKYGLDHLSRTGVFYYGNPAISRDLGGTLTDIMREIFANLILSQGDMTAQYRSLIARWDAAGGRTLEEQATVIYKAENNIR